MKHGSTQTFFSPSKNLLGGLAWPCCACGQSHEELIEDSKIDLLSDQVVLLILPRADGPGGGAVVSDYGTM